MKDDSKNYIDQYKLLFYSTWTVLYFIFPAWRFPNIRVPFSMDVIQSPPFAGLMYLAYFFISAYLLNYFFRSLSVDTPLIIHSDNRTGRIKDNLWLVIICFIAAILHIPAISPLDSAAGSYSLWIYNFITSHWHKIFDLPIQYPLWIFIVFLIFTIKQKRLVNFISRCLNSGYSAYKSNRSVKLLALIFMTGIFILYTRILPGYSWRDHIFIIGYPPLSTLLYLIIYALFGTGTTFSAPIIIQFAFYILSGVFLYKTINLFYEKEAALLGSSIYLFSPLIFTYGTLGHIGSGTVFFIILTAYFFLKFIRDGNDRDLVLTTYSISLGSLYKSEIVQMFFICSAYLVCIRLRRKDLHLKNYLQVLSLSFISFLPWLLVGTRGADSFIMSHLTNLDSLLLYFSKVSLQVSWPVFLLFLLSIIFVLSYKREPLTLFFGLVFVIYYVLYTASEQQQRICPQRYSMAFYPTISVFLALFIYGTLKKIRWRFVFKAISAVLILYLAILCVIPRSSTDLITFKYTDGEIQRYPFNEALEWIQKESGDNEKVLVLGLTTYEFYARQKGLGPEKILFIPPGEIKSLLPLDNSDDIKSFGRNLEELCRKLKTTYIIFGINDTAKRDPVNNSRGPRKLSWRSFVEENKYDNLIRTAKFNIDDTYIYIYKVGDNPAERQ